MTRKATQIAVPIICSAELDVKSLTDKHERSEKDLNEHLADGWRIFSTHTVNHNLTVFLVYVLVKIEHEKCKEELTC